MIKYYFFILLFLSFSLLSAQEKLTKEERVRREKNIKAGNPFVKYGCKAPVATLSKGKYLEVHDLDSIVIIGTTRWNVYKKIIVGEIKIDSLNLDAQPTGDVPGMWMSPDPLSEEYPSWNPYNYCFNNPINLIDPTGMSPDDIVTFNMQGKEISRIESNTVFKTYVQLDNGTKVEASMPNVIAEKSGMNTTGAKYQKYDYNIAAETAIFNINKSEGITPTHANGKSIDDVCEVPDLDPTLVKATIMQESTMGTYDRNPKDSNDSKSDIMQANVYYSEKSNDWGAHKSQFGLKKGGGATPAQSIKAGIGLMYQKGLKTSNGHTSWIGGKKWDNASKRYNGGGAANYGNVLKMRDASVTPTPSSYITR